jgi:rhodanese-related sulfurtransferase
MDFLIDFFAANWAIFLIIVAAFFCLIKINLHNDKNGIFAKDIVQLNNLGKILLVDIRDHESFKECKIISSYNYHNINDIKKIWLENKNKEIILVCNKGKMSAAFVTSLLNSDDSIKVRYLIGGINKWKIEGFPVEAS